MKKNNKNKKANLKNVAGGLGAGTYTVVSGLSYDNSTGTMHLNKSNAGIKDPSRITTTTLTQLPGGYTAFTFDDGLP